MQRRPRAVVEAALRSWTRGDTKAEIIAAAGVPETSFERWLEWAGLPARPIGAFVGARRERWIRRHAGTPVKVPAAAVEPPPLPPHIDLQALRDDASRRSVVATLEQRGVAFQRHGMTLELQENLR